MSVAVRAAQETDGGVPSGVCRSNGRVGGGGEPGGRFSGRFGPSPPSGPSGVDHGGCCHFSEKGCPKRWKLPRLIRVTYIVYSPRLLPVRPFGWTDGAKPWCPMLRRCGDRRNRSQVRSPGPGSRFPWQTARRGGGRCGHRSRARPSGRTPYSRPGRPGAAPAASRSHQFHSDHGERVPEV